ncbi:hypothetical protein ACFL59_00700 [Planctomycetota bacterium]
MSVGGIGGGHVGATSQSRASDMLGSFGDAAFDTFMDGATLAAGTMGGPAASSAMSSLRGGSGSGSAVDTAVGTISDRTDSKLGQIGGDADKAQDRQEDFFRLQFAINTQSQTNNMLTNMQKARHDAMIATIQNTR